MKTQLVRDVPIGILLVVLSLCSQTFVQYLAGWPSFWHLVGIMLAAGISWRLMLVGVDLVMGIEMRIKNDKE